MKVAEIKKKAKDLGMTCGKMKKAELILSIQRVEGNQPCYGSSGGKFSYNDCCFIKDCLKTKI